MQKYIRSKAKENLPANWMLLLAVIALFLPSAAAERIVETPVATLHLSAGSCDLIGVSWRSPAMEIIREPQLGENFRLLLPLPIIRQITSIAAIRWSLVLSRPMIA